MTPAPRRPRFARTAAALLLVVALAGCVPERPAFDVQPERWTIDGATLDSLGGADGMPAALALARRHLRMVRAGLLPSWRRDEAVAVERELGLRAALPAPGRAALATADRALAAARSSLAADSLARAETLCRAAWDARRMQLGEGALATSEAALALAQVEFLLSHAREADSLAIAARAQLCATLGRTHPLVADAEELLGRIVKNYTGGIGRDLAFGHYDEALRVRAATEGPHSLAFASTLQQIGNMHRLAGEPVTALALFRTALEIRRDALGPVNEEVASTLGAMAFLCAGRSRWADAESLASGALAATPAGPGGGIGSRAGRLGLRGQMLRRLGRDAEAVGVLREAVALRESLWARTSRDAGNSVISGLNLYRDLALALQRTGKADEAFEVLDRGSSRALGAHQGGAPADSGNPWRDLRERVQANLGPDEALVSWPSTTPSSMHADDPHWACVVRAQGHVTWVPLGDDAGTVAHGISVREALWTELHVAGGWTLRATDTTAVSALARRYWRGWFAPLLPALAGVHHIVVCAPDLMAGGPLAPLQDDAGGWLGERYVISYSTSALRFVRGREHQAATGPRRSLPALLVGDPAYAPDDPDHWSRLAGAGDELRALAARLPGATLIVGAEASAARLRALAATGVLGRYRVLHFAAHADFDARRVLESALVLAPDARGDPVSSRLLAREVASAWRLDADLVSLAACHGNAGLGSATDGALGLQQAFLAAGAHSLLVGLWPVDDHATAILMDAFYARLLDRAHPVDRATALQQAQHALRTWRAPDGERPYAHPAYWAAFALVGDPG